MPEPRWDTTFNTNPCPETSSDTNGVGIPPTMRNGDSSRGQVIVETIPVSNHYYSVFWDSLLHPQHEQILRSPRRMRCKSFNESHIRLYVQHIILQSQFHLGCMVQRRNANDTSASKDTLPTQT